MMKKVLALFLAALLCIGCLPSVVFAADAAVWDGSIATEFAGGSGTEADPYLISNGAELALLAKYTNANTKKGNTVYRLLHYKLTADLDLGGAAWTPIGSSGWAFGGSLVGDGHTITNLRIESGNYCGLFGNLAGSVCDMTIADGVLSSSGYYVGAFAGQSSAGKLCNVHVVNTTVKGSYGVGGVIGFVSGTTTLCCSGIEGGSVLSTGTLYGAGGLIGSIGGSSGSVTVSRSYCEADSVKSTYCGGAGGIVGAQANGVGTSAMKLYVKDCYNTAAITAGMPINSTSYYNGAGGIVGVMRNAYSTIEACWNSGSVTTGNATTSSIKSYGGGISGYVIAESISNCLNLGQVATTNTSTKYKSAIGTIRAYNASTKLTNVFYLEGCVPAANNTRTVYTEGTAKADEAAMIETANGLSAFANSSAWVTHEDRMPTLTGCIDAEGNCSCGCGCKCAPHEAAPETYTVTYEYPAGTVVYTDTVSTDANYVLRGTEDFYTICDAERGQIITGWLDQNGNTYAPGGEIAAVKSDLKFTPVTEAVIVLRDGETREVIGCMRRGEAISEVAYGLNYTNETPGAMIHSIQNLRKTVDTGISEENERRLAFAGWFYEPYNPEIYDLWKMDWSAENNVGQDDLFGENSKVKDHSIYAYWIDEGYLKTTFGYTSTEEAAKVFALSTVPDDLFANYGFVLTTGLPYGVAEAEELRIGGIIGGLNVRNIQKTTVYQRIGVAPFTVTRYANSLNGSLGGAYVHDSRHDGYISYCLITNFPVGKTMSTRPYYTTLEGTLVYGDVAQTTVAPDASEIVSAH